MLTVTQSAEEAVRRIVSETTGEETAGVRLAPGPATPEGVAIQLSVVEAPETADLQAGGEDVHVYLEPTVAEFLDDKVLDADVGEGKVMFAVRDAGYDPSANGAPPAE